MNTILNSLSEADKNKSFLTIYKDGADFDIKLSDFASAISKGSLKLLNGIDLSASLTEVTDSIGTISPLQLSTESVGLSRTVNLAAGATTPRLFNVAYTINNSGAQTGTLTGIFLNATETALNGITHNLMDLQVGGVSAFKVTKFGELLSSGYLKVASASSVGWAGTKSQMFSPIDGNILLQNNASTNFSLLQLGGTTSSFPAIKRNGVDIYFRLADDSAYTGFYASTGNFQGGLNTNSTGYLRWSADSDSGSAKDLGLSRHSANVLRISDASTGAGNLFIGASTGYNASAVLQADSTTKGFLMPRQTQAQILAIVSPANGLQVFNTDINTPCFYDGLGWRKVSHSSM